MRRCLLCIKWNVWAFLQTTFIICQEKVAQNERFKRCCLNELWCCSPPWRIAKGGGGVLIPFHKLILEKFTCNIYKRENFKSPFLCSRFQGNLEVFTKWKKKFMDHIYFGKQIMFNVDSKLLESCAPFCEIQYYT